ncbi:MAG: sigma-70 family RNA polymerase sigma factor [Acidimicrobiales bacterium]
MAYTAGSAAAGDRLVSLAGVDSTVVDLVAASAATGSERGLELLLRLVDQLDLAAPAIARLSNNGALIEDIEQEVLVAVSGSIERFRGDSKFTTWLYALTRNVAIGQLRRLRPEDELAESDLLANKTLRRMSSIVTQREVVREAIDSLPPIFRETVLLRDIEGLSYAEIAKRQGLEINTVRSRLSRGRALLAGRLS